MDKFAVVVTAVFSTLNVSAMFLIMAGWFSGSVLAGVVAAIVGVGGPMVLIRVASKRGVIADRFISDHSKRWPFSIAMSLSLALAGGLVILFGAPLVMLWATSAVLACVVLVGVFNLFWKMSAHGTIAGLLAGAVTLALPSYGFWAWGIPIAVGWSRVYLKAHTPPQVLAGIAGGFLVSLSSLLIK